MSGWTARSSLDRYTLAPVAVDDPLSVITVLSRDGTSIAAFRNGSGPSLVLVHGGRCDHTIWDGILPQLGRHFTVYAMERRGRGPLVLCPVRAGSHAPPTLLLEGEVSLAFLKDSVAVVMAPDLFTSEVLKLLREDAPRPPGEAL